MKYFGTDGIRGLAYEFINENLSYAIGKSLYLFKDSYDKVIIAKDTRESSKMIVDKIKEGAFLAGIDVCDIGVCATPILAYASEKYCCMGIMVTASHNPYHDNGIKVFFQGKKSLTWQEEMIESVIDNGIDFYNEKLGKAIEIPEIFALYFGLYQEFSPNRKLRVALDLANGATVTSAVRALGDFCVITHVIGNSPDGFNINKNCGSTSLDMIKQIVVENKLDLGFAFDGDGDRVLGINHLGEIIDGDFLIYLFSRYLFEHNQLNNNLVVLSKMSNIGIIKALEAIGLQVIQTDVGDKYIFKALEEMQAVIGGENSGHIINKTLINTGDGVLNAWYLLKVLDYFNESVADLQKKIYYYPNKLYNITNIDKELAKEPEVMALVSKYDAELGNDGKVLVRASGTEPLIRVSASAKGEAKVDEIIQSIVSLIEKKGKGA